MMWRRAYAVFLRYAMLLFGSPQRLFQIVIWGSLDVLIFGYLTRFLDTISAAELNVASVILGGIILLDILTRIQQGTATPVLEDIWSNNLLNYFASPLRISEYIIGLIGASITTTAIATVIMVIVAHFVFGFSLFTLGLPLVGFLIILFLFGIALGIFGATIVLRFGPSAEWYVWPMTLVLSPLMGVLYPVSILPEWMQALSHVLAPTYVFAGMRDILLRGDFAVSDLAFGFALAVATLALAAFAFARTYRYIVRLGLFARYSAESL